MHSGGKGSSEIATRFATETRLFFLFFCFPFFFLACRSLFGNLKAVNALCCSSTCTTAFGNGGPSRARMRWLWGESLRCPSPPATEAPLESAARRRPLSRASPPELRVWTADWHRVDGSASGSQSASQCNLQLATNFISSYPQVLCTYGRR